MPTAPYYQDDHVTLYHGDCLEIAVWLEADVLVTDPPYGRAWALHGGGVGRVGVKKAGIRNDSNTGVRDAALAAWGDKPAVVFGTWAEQIAGARQTLVWRKPADAGVIGSTTGFRTDTELIFLLGQWPLRGAQWSSVLVTESNKNAYLRPGSGHPHAKPAAKALGREAIGVEIDERYCEIAARRLAQGVLDFGEAV